MKSCGPKSFFSERKKLFSRCLWVTALSSYFVMFFAPNDGEEAHFEFSMLNWVFPVSSCMSWNVLLCCSWITRPCRCRPAVIAVAPGMTQTFNFQDSLLQLVQNNLWNVEIEFTLLALRVSGNLWMSLLTWWESAPGNVSPFPAQLGYLYQLSVRRFGFPQNSCVTCCLSDGFPLESPLQCALITVGGRSVAHQWRMHSGIKQNPWKIGL